MRRHFYFPFFVFTGIAFLSVFFAGFFLAKSKEPQLRHSLLKRSVKSQSLSLSLLLNKKKNFLIEEGQKIQNEGKISKESPFFALVVSRDKGGELVYISEEVPPFYFEEPELNPSDKKKAFSKRRRRVLFKKQRAFFIQQARAFFSQDFLKSSAFYFGVLERDPPGPPIVFFADSFGKKFKMAFLKPEKGFFTLKEGSSALSGEGKIFFHSEISQIFKRIPKKSPLRASLKPVSKKASSSGLYVFSKKTREMHYLQKWEGGNLLLTVKKRDPSTLWWGEGGAFKAFFIGLALFCLSFTLFCFKLFPLVSAYQFLKKAFLSFSSERLFPSTSSTRNPWLYFYSNRRPFLKIEAEEPVSGGGVGFQDLIRREEDRLKLLFPQIAIKEDFDFDVQVFSFEKFLRLIVRELLKNAIEAMGGRERLKMDLSLQKEGECVLFSVRDYGGGVPDGDYEKLFRLYYSTKNQAGTGLNLAQSIIGANGGEMFFSSPEGGGFKIGFRLPLKGFLKNHF